jgi:hypothetical protein
LDNYFVKKKIPLKYKTLLDRGKSWNHTNNVKKLVIPFDFLYNVIQSNLPKRSPLLSSHLYKNVIFSAWNEG